MERNLIIKKVRPSGRIFFVCALLLVLSRISAQSYYFEQYLFKQGLDQAKVYCVLQDKKYQVWLGTYSGLSKFDGQHVVTVKDDGLIKKAVRSIFEDSRGFIWAGHLDGGISRYDGSKFDSVPGLNFQKDVSGFCEDEKGNIWITTVGSGAICVTNPGETKAKAKFKHYLGKEFSDRVFGGIHTHDNKLYFITDAGVKVFNQKTEKFENLALEGLSDLTLNFFQITKIFEDRSNNLWFGTYNGGLYEYRRTGKRLIKYYDVRDGLSNNWISSIIQDRRGAIWVGTWLGSSGGLTRIDENGLKSYGKFNGLPDHCIYSLAEDAEGNLLMGTQTNGLLVFKGEAFSSFSEKELPTPQVYSILQDSEGNYWFGTNGGISVFNPKASENKQITKIIGDENSLPPSPENLRFIKEDKNRTLWIVSEKMGLYEYNLSNRKFVYSIVNASLPMTKKITSLEVDKKGNLWFGTLDGLYFYYLSATESTSKLPFGTSIFSYGSSAKPLVRLSQEDGLAGIDISTVYIDENDVKYIGVRNKGITVFKDTLTTKSPKYTLLGSTTPVCITKDNEGVLWIGTENEGVLCFKDGKVVKHYQKQNGLLSDVVASIAADSEGNVYVGTSLGLSKINKKTGTIYTYTERNGFAGIEAKNNAVFKDKNGILWFGTANGVVKYNSKLDFTPTQQPLTKILRFVVNREETPLENNIKLNYKQNSLVFEFASVCINNPDAVEYQVKLQGADEDWWPASKLSFKEYTGLQPGHYIFMVKAKNSAGIWNSDPQTFEFSIKPPFYRTWWFISMCVIIGAIVIVVYIKVREQKLIREKKILEDTVRERTAEVVQANIELAHKNKDILDSIQYASRIQKALMPPDLPFENTFVLFRPKDIVSGDFFWFVSDGKKEWFAAADCTGHGVPGAFMTIIGLNSLNQIVKELGITEPGEILNRLNKDVTSKLHQYAQGEQIHDGMDISLVCYDRENRKLEYAGAFNPLWMCRNGGFSEVRATRSAIGMSGEAENEKWFTNNIIDIEPGDSIYIFSDGYADQFGGPDLRKMKVGKFREHIIDIQKYSMHVQKQMLEKFHDDWKGSYQQIDDILVIGRKF